MEEGNDDIFHHILDHDNDERNHPSFSIRKSKLSADRSFGTSPINTVSVDRGIDNSRNTLSFVFQSKNYEKSEARVVQELSVKLDFTPEEWWLRLVYRHLNPSKSSLIFSRHLLGSSSS
jgi:hypothetical protein